MFQKPNVSAMINGRIAFTGSDHFQTNDGRRCPLDDGVTDVVAAAGRVLCVTGAAVGGVLGVTGAGTACGELGLNLYHTRLPANLSSF